MPKMTMSEAGKLGAAKSKITQAKQLLDRIQLYETSPTLCKRCETALPYERRMNLFCCSSCAANHNNAKRIVRKSCLQCGSEIKKASTKYCSIDCMNLYHTLQAIKNGTASVVTIKRHLINTKRACSVCGLLEWTGRPMPLEIHHIDGNPVNNDFANLVLICPNCHALTDNYKAKNKGNGRVYRKDRYKQGKSY